MDETLQLIKEKLTKLKMREGSFYHTKLKEIDLEKIESFEFIVDAVERVHKTFLENNNQI